MLYRSLIAIAISQLLTGPVFASGSVYFCNKTANNIQVAVAEHSDGRFGSQGWLNVLSGYCEKVRNLSASGERLFWVARTAPLLDAKPETSWEDWEEVAQEAPILCVGREADRNFHFDDAARDKKCSYRMRFSTMVRQAQDVVIRLTGRDKPLATSDDSPIAIRDRNGDLVPKTLIFSLACSTRWDGGCEERKTFELPPESEYCSHFMHIAEMNHGSASVPFTAPGYTHAWVYAVGSGNRFDRWGGNAHQRIYVGVVPFGQYSKDRCLPHASWLGYCDLPGGEASCSGRCANLSELNQVKDPECMQKIESTTARWIRKNKIIDTPPQQSGLSRVEIGFPSKIKSGDFRGETRQGSYFSIVGSFRTRAAALRHRVNLQAIDQGLDLDVYLPFRRSRYWVVASAQFSTLPDAKSASDYARDKLPNHDSFVLRMPNVTR